MLSSVTAVFGRYPLKLDEGIDDYPDILDIGNVEIIELYQKPTTMVFY